jgi:hypothetical protein
MTRLTEQQKTAIKESYQGGAKVKDILSTHKIAKASFYKLKSKWVETDDALPHSEMEPETDAPENRHVDAVPEDNEKMVTFNIDAHEAHLDQLNPSHFPKDDIDTQFIQEQIYNSDLPAQDYAAPPSQILNQYEAPNRYESNWNPTQDPEFDTKFLDSLNIYDPTFITDSIKEGRKQPSYENIKVPMKLNAKRIIKEASEELTKEETNKVNDEERQKLIYIIRKYVYAFKDNLGLQSIVGKTDMAREKFVYTILSKSLGELRKMESAIKFHVRAELSGSSQL